MHPILLHFGPWTFDIPWLAIGAIVGAIVGIFGAQATGAEGKRVGLGAVAGLVAGLILAVLAKGTGSLHVQDWEPKVHTFGPLVALGAFTAIVYIRREGLRRNIDPELLTGFAVETLLVGVAGSRVLFCLITPEAFPPYDPKWSLFEYHVLHFREHFPQYFMIWNGGLVWYGGLLPAAIFAMWRARQLGIPVRTMTDVFSPAVMFGLAVGRIGCLMAGDDHGRLIESGAHWWTLTFTDPNALVTPDSLKGKPLYPSQPHMAIGAFLIGCVCHWASKRLRDRPGAVMFVMLTLYPIHRFIVEFFRGDAVRKFLIATAYDEHGEATAGLSTSQAISIPLVLLSVSVLIWMLRRPARGPEPIPASAAARPPEKDAGKPDAAPGAAAPAPAPAPAQTASAASPAPVADPAPDAAKLAPPPASGENRP